MCAVVSITVVDARGDVAVGSVVDGCLKVVVLLLADVMVLLKVVELL